MARRNKRKNKRKSLFSSGLARIAATALVICCVVLIVIIETDCAQKEADLLDVQEKISVLEAENMEIQRVLDSDDMSDYMEKIALEDQGYAYPDERRFYDTSRD